MRLFKHDSEGKFTSFKTIMKKIGIRIGLILVLIDMGMVFSSAFYLTGNTTTYQAPITVHAEDNFAGRITQLRADVVNQVETCESVGISEADGYVKVDNNSKGTLKGEDVFSFGKLQWKIKTVKQYVKMRDGKTITSKDAIELALDEAKAKDLADYTVFETDGGIHNWENCSAQLKLVDKVGVIKQIMK